MPEILSARLSSSALTEPEADAKPAPSPATARRLGVGFWLNLLGVLLLFAALRWNTFDLPLVRDEGEYAYAAQLLQHGLMPYEHSFLQKPPMVAYSYAAAAAVAPKLFWAPRLLAYLFAAAATGLLGWVARREFGPGSLWPAIWMLTPMLLLPGRDQTTANTEMFLVLPLAGLFAVYSFYREQPAGKAAWFGAGALAAVSFLYKYTVAPLLAVVFVAWVWQQWRGDAERGPRFPRQCWYALLGAGAVATLILVWFVARDGGWHLWECTIRFNRYYADSSNFGFSGVGYWLKVFWKAWWIVFLLPLGLWLAPRPRTALWCLFFAAAWLTTAMSRYGHYYIVLMPFWALLGAAGLDRLAVLTGKWFSQHRPGVTRLCPEGGTRGLLTVAAVGLLCWPAWPGMRLSREQVREGQPDVLIGSRTVASRLATLTAPHDRVFIAGSEPQILCYAQRLSATRFDIMYPMMLPTPLAEGYQKEAALELEQHPPAAIVFVPAASSWLRSQATPSFFPNYLGMILEQHYELVGGFVADAASGHWVEPLSERELPAASLRLYKRR